MAWMIEEAGSLIESIGTYARLTIVGVWFPGFLLFCELGSTYFGFFGPADQGLFGYLAAETKEFDSPVLTFLVVVFVLATSISLGYVARDLAFAISDFWLRRGWPPVRRLTKVYDSIRRVYGDTKVDDVARRYPVFRLATGDVDSTSLPRMPESYVREFCKQWLRVNVPSLNTEGLEIEINLVMGLVMPVALASIVFLSFFGLRLAIPLAVVSVAAATFLMYRINWARNIETEQSILNFLFAHWEGLPAAAAAKPAESSDA
jgi:hypothetical protein